MLFIYKVMKMDHRLTCKMENYKHVRRNHRKIPGPTVWQRITGHGTKIAICERKRIDRLGFFSELKLLLCKDHIKKNKV